MARNEDCIPGMPGVCHGMPCNVQDIPKLPNIAEIFKTCPVQYDLASCWILLLLVPISIVSMIVMRRYVLPLLEKRPGESSGEKADVLVPLNTSPAVPESQTSPATETAGESEPAGESELAIEKDTNDERSAREVGEDLESQVVEKGNVSPAVESKTHPV